MNTLRLALLHLSPKLGDLVYNRRVLKTAVDAAQRLGANWIVTPELCLTGYDFAPRLGADWIESQPDPWMKRFCAFVAARKVTVFLGHAERDHDTNKCYNTVFVIGPDGAILGSHRKRSVIPGVEAWASRWDCAIPVLVPEPALKVGILVCADAYTSTVADQLKDKGAQMLVSSAAWGPKPHGPERSWEDRSRETGLPLFVCNRTGKDNVLDFSEAETVVASRGRRLISHQGTDPAIVFVEWDLQNQTPKRHHIYPLELSDWNSAQ